MFFSVYSTWRRSYGLLLAATLVVVIAADYLLYGRAIGCAAAIVATVMLVVMGVRDTRFLRTKGGRVIAVAAIGLLLSLVEAPTTLNICYAIVCLAALAVINAGGWEPDFWPWLKRMLRWLNREWVRIFADNGMVVRFLLRRGASPRTARGIAAWFVPVLLASVFVAIFAFANPVIANWLSRLREQIGEWLGRLPELINLGRIVFWTGFATFAWMLCRGRVHRRRTAAPLAELCLSPGAAPVRKRQLAAGFAVRCLLLFNIVFAIENVLDTRYLFDPKSLPQGMSYTEYVHRGAYPLIGAALLAAAFVLITFRPASEIESSRAARVLVYAWIGQTIVLTLSAGWRLEQYISMSLLTRWRVASAIWFLLVALGLSYIIWRIVRRRSNTWLVNINALTVLVVLYPCCFINFDGLIARYNVTHCPEAGGSGTGLDIEYLRILGTPALPALDGVINQITAPPRRALANEVSAELHQRLAEELKEWQSWTWRRHRIASASWPADVVRPSPGAVATSANGQRTTAGLK